MVTLTLVAVTRIADALKKEDILKMYRRSMDERHIVVLFDRASMAARSFFASRKEIALTTVHSFVNSNAHFHFHL